MRDHWRCLTGHDLRNLPRLAIRYLDRRPPDLDTDRSCTDSNAELRALDDYCQDERFDLKVFDVALFEVKQDRACVDDVEGRVLRNLLTKPSVSPRPSKVTPSLVVPSGYSSQRRRADKPTQAYVCINDVILLGY